MRKAKDIHRLLENVDLIKEKNKAKDALPGKLKEYFIDDNDITEIDYPVMSYPLKVKSLSLDKTSGYSGKLTGIKGQYLIFNDGDVLNIRKHGGYYVQINKI